MALGCFLVADSICEVCHVMSFLARPTFVPVAMHNFAHYVLSFRGQLNVNHLPADLFCFFCLSFSVLHHLSYSRGHFIVISFPDVVIATDTMPNQWDFIFRVLGYLHPLVVPCQILCVEFI